MELRLLNTCYNTPAMNMGIDEAVLRYTAEGKSPPTLRFYGWDPPAVSIGYFQGLNEEVDLEQCTRSGVHYVRRMTGGGAVFHNTEMTYSIMLPEKHPLVVSNILDSYKRVCSGLISGFAFMGVEAQFVPLNDIVTGGKKISGNAQSRKYHGFLQHGTILMDIDAETMFSLLIVPSEKMRDKLVKNVKERVTSLNHVLNREVTFQETVDAFTRGFSEALKVELVPGELTSEEKKRAAEIAGERYSNPDWNHKR